MSLTSEYWNAKRKKEENKKKQSSNTGGNVSPVKTTNSYWNAKNSVRNGDFDIAPIMSAVTNRMTVTSNKNKEDERKWFQKGAFEDGYDFGDVTKTILGIDEDSASFLDLTWNSAKRGYYNARYGEESFKAMDGLANEKEAYEKLLSSEDYQFAPGNEFASGVSGAFELIGQQARQFTHPRTLAATGAAAAGAFALGQAGPQVLAPEEIVTVPGAAIAGFTAGSAAANFQIEAGHAYNEMLEAGISEKTAKRVASAVGGVNAGLELLQVDELVDAYKVAKGSGATKNFAKKILDELVDRGVDVAKETAQEVAQEGVTIAGVQAASKLDKDEWAYNAEDVSNRLLDTAKSSALSFGLMNVPATVKNTVSIANEQKHNDNTLTEMEQKVVDKVYEDKLAEKQEKGEVSQKDQKALYQSVVDDMKKGYIPTDTIEEVLGGETYKSYKDTVDNEDALQQEFDTLNKMKQGDMTGEQIDRRAELKEQLAKITEQSQRNQLKTQLGDEVFSLVKGENGKGSRLLESYNEVARRRQTFNADLSKYDSKYHATIQNAIDSGLLNNTNRSHEMVDFIAKISADKGVPFNFANNAKIKETGFAVDGAIVNGYRTADGITINVESPKYLQSTVGHEITHVLEGTELYDSLKETIFNYAKTKGEYDSRMASLTELYKDVKDADIEGELAADLVGDYLFQDSDFVNRLSTENRNVFQKIYDEIKYLCKVVTAGSKEAKELEKVKKAFENAYRANVKGKADTQTKHSLSTKETDKAYIDAVNGGDIETAQKMVDDVAGEWSEGNEIYVTDPETGEVQFKFYRSADGGRTVWNGHGNNQAQGVFLTSNEFVANAFDPDGKHITVYAKAKNPFVIDAKGRGYTRIQVDEDTAPDWLYEMSSLDWDWSDQANDDVYFDSVDIDNLYPEAFKQGYDAVIVTNVVEGVGGGAATDIVLKDGGTQMKSADPVTYDDNGNVIPLSERFNPDNDDIRYSLSENGETPKKYGNFATPAKEIAYEGIAPVANAVAEDVAQETVAQETKRPETRKELHQDIIDNIKNTFAKDGLDFDKVLKDAKNLSTFATVDNTPQRVMEKALGYKEGNILSDLTVNKVADNETKGIKWLNSFTDRKNGFLAQLSKQYNIKPGSKESAAAQMYAEGFYVDDKNNIIQYGDAELAADFKNEKVRENIKKLARDPRIRKVYDETLAMINESRSRNAYPEIPRLDNYFLHFRAMEDTFSRLGLPFNPNDIKAKDLPTDLNGVTADLKPGQPYFASAMHREGKRTSFDLLGGMERYLTSAKNQIYHIDDIQTLRALRNYIADTYGRASGLEDLDSLSDAEAEERIKQVYGSHLSTFAKFLNEEANVLAGKTALIDRGLEGIIGRRGITFLNTINQQVGANMVGWNISSSLTNFLPVAQTFAKTNKFDFTKAFAQTVANKISGGKLDTFTEDSPVVIRRKGADRFYRTPWQKLADPGYVLMSAVDDISTEIIARTKYNEFVRKGMDSQKAHYETDKWVSRLMGDRSLGQMPQLYNSKMLGLITKFQLEVRNQLDSQFYDTIQETKTSNENIQNGILRNAKTAAKVASVFAQLAIAQHLYGKAFESVAGYNPAFDIIEVLMTAFGFDDDEESEDTVLDNLTQGLLELSEDLPYASTFTGGRIPISAAIPDVGAILEGEDEYGNEIGFVKALVNNVKEIAPYYLSPGGYGQFKKTKAGLKMFSDEHPVAGSYTDSGNLRFTVEDTVGNRIKAGIFGQYATETARKYFDEEQKTLNPDQTNILAGLDIPVEEYWQYRDDLAKFNSKKNELKELANADNATDEDVLKYTYASFVSSDLNKLYDQQKEIASSNDANKTDKLRRLQSEMEQIIANSKNATDNAYTSGLYGEVGDKRFNKDADSGKWYEIKPKKADGTDNYFYKQEQKVTKGLGISYEKYWNNRDEYDYAYKNPEKYALSKAVGGYESYRRYSSDLYDIKADKDENGNSISGSRKEKVIDYINNMDADYGEKMILFKNEYPADDTYNREIVEYLNSRKDISYKEKVSILKELEFKIDSDGNVTW